jgi:hypothetical protein
MLADLRERFRSNYLMMLNAILGKIPCLTAFTIYNSVPGISDRALAVLALFNEVILQEATALGLPIVDLRLVCNEESDFSSVSPIEPSGMGSAKIADRINTISTTHDFGSKYSTIYK